MPTLIIPFNALELKKRLFSAFKCIGTSTVLPVLEATLVRLENKRLSFTCTDLETTCVCTFDTEAEGQSLFLIDAKPFLYFLRNAVQPECELKVTATHSIFVSGFFKLKQPLADSPDNFPKPVVVDNESSFTIPSNNFIHLLKRAKPFISKDDLRPSMTGVLLHDVKGRLTIAATDAHRLYWEDFMDTPESLKDKSVIIFDKAVGLIIENFNNETLSISTNFLHINIKGQNFEITSRLIDVRYPDYSVVIARYPLQFYIKRKQFIAFLSLCIPFVNKSTRQIICSVSNDEITVEGGEVDYSTEFDYSLPIYNATQKHEGFKFALDTKFITETLKVNRNDDLVKIEHSTLPTKAIVIDDHFLIMPLMINN